MHMADPTFIVYVLELEPTVWDVPKFQKEHIGHARSRECLYIGQTAKTVEERLKLHLAGEDQSNKYVCGFFKKIRHDLVPQEMKSFLKREDALAAEAKLGEALRKLGHPVWYR